MSKEVNTPDASIILTTAKNKGEAKKIASALLKAKLAACIQFITIDSFYFWEGSVQNDPEILLLIKCKFSDFESIESEIKSIHSYDVPEILMIKVDDGSKDYLKWILDVTRK